MSLITEIPEKVGISSERLARVDDRPTGFIVPADSPGVIRGPKEINIGQHASNTVRVTLEDVKVEARNRLGEEGDGFQIAMKTFDHTRPGVAAGANGITKAALSTESFIAAASFQQTTRILSVS